MKFSLSSFPNSFIVALLILCGLAVYAPSFKNEMFWDDNDFILNNTYIKEWKQFPKLFTGNVIEGAELVSNYYRPVLLTVFSIEWHLWGTSVAGWHIVNALVHALNAALLFLLLEKLFKKRWLALLASSIFLLHPVQVEAVAYVNSFGDSLSLFWMLLSLLFFYRAIAAKANAFTSLWYYAALALYPLAVLSKETAIILPGLIFLISFFQDRRTFWQRTLKALLLALPFLIAGGAYMLLRAGPLNFQNTFNLYNESNAFTTSILLRIATFFKIFVVYIGLIFWPQHLHMERTIAVSHAVSLATVGGGLIVLVIIAAIIKFWKKIPELSFGLLWFLVALVPTSNIIIPINGLLYEHWLYVPLIGFALAILVVVGRCFDRIQSRSRYDWKPLIAGVVLIIIMILATRTVLRIQQWRSPISLYTQTLQYAPYSYRVLNNLGMAYADRSDPYTAIAYYIKAVAVDDRNPVAYHNLGNAYQSVGDFNQAAQQYERALAIDPKFLYSYSNLINIYLDAKNYNRAKELLQQLLTLGPNAQAAALLAELDTMVAP